MEEGVEARYDPARERRHLGAQFSQVNVAEPESVLAGVRERHLSSRPKWMRSGLMSR